LKGYREQGEWGKEGLLGRVYLELPPVSVSSDAETNSTEMWDSKSNSDHDPDVPMHMEYDVDAPDGVNLDCNLDMEWDSDNEEEEDAEEEDDEVEEDEDEDEDEDDGKEPQTIGQGETLNTLLDHVEHMVDDEPTMLPNRGQEMPEHTPWP
jgi:hypothetical protein